MVSSAGKAQAIAPVYQPRFRCRFCGNYQPQGDFILPNDLAISPCLDCHRANEAALAALANKSEPGCWECRKTLSQIAHDTGKADVRMYLHKKDGLFQLLCPRCSDAYERKRLDLYGSTPYGERKKLSGAK